MKNVSKYRIIKAADPDNLGKKVQEAINEGWQPHGGITHFQAGGKDLLCQPLTLCSEALSASPLTQEG